MICDALKGYKKGEWGHFTPGASRQFLGLGVMRNMENRIELPQTTFTSRMQEMKWEIAPKGARVISAEQLRTVYRSVLGACIWLHQTRFGVSYQVTSLATCAWSAIDHVSDIKKFAGQINKLIRTLKARPVSILYGEMWMGRKPISRKMLLRLTLFGFSDAGYATLTGHKSQESCIPVWGTSLARW